MKPYQIVLGAGQMVPMPVTGSKVVVRSTSGAVNIRSDDGLIDLSSVLAGEGSEGIPFTLLFITNPGASSVTLELVISEGEFRSNRVFLTGGVGVSNTLTTSSNTYSAGSTSKAAIAGQIRVAFRCDNAMPGTITIAGLPYSAGEGDIIDTSTDVAVVATGTQTVYWRQEASV